ncbi:hypothetical protein [Halioxenophilus aromaticivorans]
MRQSKSPLSASSAANTPPNTVAATSFLSVSQSNSARAMATVVFGINAFDQSALIAAAAQQQAFGCELPLLAGDCQVENWHVGDQPVERGQIGAVHWACGGGFLFVGLTLDCGSADDITALAKLAYEQLLALVAESASPHLLRCWNYVPNINGGMEKGNADHEVYKRFCTGRLRAFEQAGLQSADFPAASAVGHSGDSLTIHLLASQTPGCHLANTKQVDAFSYPRQYGISSPSFARATLWQQGDDTVLLVSGTASIVGHESLHIGDLGAQVQVTFENISHLLNQANKRCQQVRFVRVYLRHEEHLAEAKALVEREYQQAEVVYLLADICRSELLVEIECFCA